MSVPDVEHLRQLIENKLAELGMPGANWCCIPARADAEGPRDSRPPRGGVLAVWRAERNAIEFHDENGSLLATVPYEQGSGELIGAAGP